MELLNGVDVMSMGFVALVSFGVVAVVNMKWKLTSIQNFMLSAGVAFILGFVPADVGSLIANKIKDALMVAFGLTGAYKSLQGIAVKVGT